MSAYDEDRDDWHADDWRPDDWCGYGCRDDECLTGCEREDDEDWIDPAVEFDLEYYGIPWTIVRRTAGITVVFLAAIRFGPDTLSWLVEYLWQILRYTVPGALN